MFRLMAYSFLCLSAPGFWSHLELGVMHKGAYSTQQATATSNPTLPFAPALYSLKATRQKGSTLVLLDKDGQETVVAQDPRPAKGRGLLGGIAHASHFGPFSMTPDLQHVVYTLFGNPSGPARRGGGLAVGGIGLAGTTQAAFGERNFEGIYVWDRTTQTSQCLATSEGLSDLGKAWLKSQGKALRSAPALHKDVEFNYPTAFFFLKDHRFLWITRSYVLIVDLKTKRISPIWAFPDGGSYLLDHAALRAWQEQDGTIHAYRANHFLTIQPDGNIRDVPWIPLQQADDESIPTYTYRGEWPIFFQLAWPQRVLVMSDGVVCTRMEQTAEGLWEKTCTWEKNHSKLLLGESGRNTYLHDHHKISNDSLSCVDSKGITKWTADLGNCRDDIRIHEADHRLIVFVVRPGNEDDIPTRLQLDLITGKILSEETWSAAAKCLPDEKKTKAPANLEDMAAVIPGAQGALVWLPASGEADDDSLKGQWEPSPALDSTLKNPHFGVWATLDSDGYLEPLLRRPYADDMVLLRKGRPTPILVSANTGMRIGTGSSTPFTPVGLRQNGYPAFPWLLSPAPRTAPFPFGRFRQVYPDFLKELLDEWRTAETERGQQK